MDPVARELFLDAMRRAASPVSVITTGGAGGRYGVTVSSVCTASADPPQMLACIHQAGPAPAAIRANGSFCVNLLGAAQRHVADSFAGRIARWRDDRFACDRWMQLATGAPVLEEALLALDCRLVQEVPLASHVGFVGLVVAVQAREGAPLLYANRDYGRLEEPGRLDIDNLQL